jgi:hypothetical protein
MTHGQTRLKDLRFLIDDLRLRSPEPIANRQSKIVNLPILDPAVGSAHFLLYCFDLLLVIYEEAWVDPDVGPALQADYPDWEAYRRAIPGMILRYNLHGIDIDPRAVQIASLALWLRAQRTYRDLGLKRTQRPTIDAIHIVCAEPMPGEGWFVRVKKLAETGRPGRDQPESVHQRGVGAVGEWSVRQPGAIRAGSGLGAIGSSRWPRESVVKCPAGHRAGRGGTR